MKVVSAFFIKSCVDKGDFPKGNLPEIAFVGRSNVGKSSLINGLLLRKNLVKTSSTPGKTQVINFFMVNNAFYFVDLPGYGYAKVPEKIRKRWGPMIEEYLSKRDNLRGVVFILDIRHLPTEEDLRMKKWLDYYKIPVLYAATKADKIKKSETERQIEKMKEALGVEHNLPIFTFSAKKNTGREDLWRELNSMLRKKSDS